MDSGPAGPSARADEVGLGGPAVVAFTGNDGVPVL